MSPKNLKKVVHKNMRLLSKFISKRLPLLNEPAYPSTEVMEKLAAGKLVWVVVFVRWEQFT